MSDWWHDPQAPWRAELAASFFPGIAEAKLNGEPPDEFAQAVEEHRLGAWLHAMNAGSDQRWASDARMAMARALLQQQVLGQMLALLHERKIEPILLKGASLALIAYEQPWHRPMRDLDLLLASEQDAVAAQQGLLDAGFESLDGSGDPGILASERHQLPVLAAPGETAFVELHLRLFHEASDETVLTRTVEREALGRRVTTLCPEAQLVHLIGHAARDHRFDNGPQVLVDLAMLWRRETIDESLLRDMLLPFGLERHASLLLRMAADAFPETGIEWHRTWESEAEYIAIASLAWRLMTGQSDNVASARDRRSLRTPGLRRLASRLAPSPARLAILQGPANGKAQLLKQYAAHYRRLATERLPRMLKSTPADKDVAAIVDWLEA